MLLGWTIEDLHIALRNNVGSGLQSIADRLSLTTTDVAFDLLQHIGSTSLYIANITVLFHLGLHIPDEIVRDVRSKYSIRNTDRKIVKARSSKKTYSQYTRLYQCLCGTDHQTGKKPSKDREIGWKDVACTSWVKLVITHDETDSGRSFDVSS